MPRNRSFPASVQPGIPKLIPTPDGWDRASLGKYLFEVKRPATLIDDEEYELVTVKRSRRGAELRDRLLGRQIKTKTQFYVEAGDFLISKRQIVHGACAIVPDHLSGAIVSNEYAVLRSRKGLDLEYLKHLAESVYFQQTCFHSSIGVHVEKLIFKLDQWLTWEFNLPPLSVQKEIVNTLRTWDEAIEKQTVLVEKIEKRQRALTYSLVFGGRQLARFQSSMPLQKYRWFSLPSNWGLQPIGNIATEVSERNFDSVADFVLSCTKYDGFVRSLEYFKKKVFSENLTNYKRIWRGDFGFPSNHIEEGSIGLQNITDLGVVSPIYTVFRFQPDTVDNDYAYAVLKTNLFRHIFQVSTSASVDRRGSLRWKEFSKIPFPIPPLSEQKSISAVLNAQHEELRVLRSELDALTRQKRGLMQKLLTGEWRVNGEVRDG